MDGRQDAYGSTGRGGVGPVDERRAAERAIRAGIAEIEAALDRLQRTCRDGKITPGELAETRDVLESQRRRMAGDG